jgi:hypothetical protein
MKFPSASKTFIENETNVDRSITSANNAAIYFKNCTESKYLVGPTTKLFIENCTNCTFVINKRIITSLLDIWNSKSCTLAISVPVQTAQIDNCTSISIVFEKAEQFQDVVWAKSKEIMVKVQGEKLVTGIESTRGLFEEFDEGFDQVYVQREEGKYKQSVVQRTARGYVELLPIS